MVEISFARYPSANSCIRESEVRGHLQAQGATMPGGRDRTLRRTARSAVVGADLRGRWHRPSGQRAQHGAGKPQQGVVEILAVGRGQCVVRQVAVGVVGHEVDAQCVAGRDGLIPTGADGVRRHIRMYDTDGNEVCVGLGGAGVNGAVTTGVIRGGRVPTCRTLDPVVDGLAHRDDQELVEIAAETIGKMVEVRAPPYITMTLWALLEQADRAMEVAMQLANSESGSPYNLELIYVDEFKVLREHKEFSELLKALRLKDYWNSVGCRWSDDQVVCDAA